MNTSRIKKLLLPLFLIFALGSTALYAANTNTIREPIDPGYEENGCATISLLIVEIDIAGDTCKGKRRKWFCE